MPTAVFKRILLKISGEALAADGVEDLTPADFVLVNDRQRVVCDPHVKQLSLIHI